MRRFIKRTLLVVLAVISSNLLLLLIVVSGPAKEPPDTLSKSEKSILLFGSSNVTYDFDYRRIPNARPLGIEEPHGLFITLMEVRHSLKKGDIVICDFVYSFYSPDKFCPATYFFYKKVTAEYYLILARQYPMLFIKHVLASNLFNTSLLEYLYRRFTHNEIIKGRATPPISVAVNIIPAKFLADKHYLPVTDSSYSNCKCKYVKEKHFVYQRNFSESHVRLMKRMLERIEEEKGVKLYFKYPELNQGNHDINPELVESIKANFHPINSFEEWPDSMMYDQWYHLNNCGRQLNTDNILAFLRRNGNIR